MLLDRKFGIHYFGHNSRSEEFFLRIFMEIVKGFVMSMATKIFLCVGSLFNPLQRVSVMVVNVIIV